MSPKLFKLSVMFDIEDYETSVLAVVDKKNMVKLVDLFTDHNCFVVVEKLDSSE